MVLRVQVSTVFPKKLRYDIASRIAVQSTTICTTMITVMRWDGSFYQSPSNFLGAKYCVLPERCKT